MHWSKLLDIFLKVATLILKFHFILELFTLFSKYKKKKKSIFLF